MVSTLSTVGVLLLLLPFPNFLSVLLQGLFSVNILRTYFLLYPRAKEKDPTQFRDAFIHYCIVLNKKGNLSTVLFVQETEQINFHPSQDRLICSLDSRQLHFVQLEASHIHSRSKLIPRKDRTSSLSITQKAFETPTSI